MKRRSVWALSVLAVTSCAPDVEEPADRILLNGHVVTLSESGVGNGEAIAIKGDRILAVGTSSAIEAFEGPFTETIDLEGKTVVPGFVDNHYHSIGGGPGVDLSSARSLEDVIEALRRRAEQTPPGEVVLTNSDWHEGQLQEQRLPFRDDLDRASTEHPIVVVRGGHEYILNSAALAHWNIDESEVSPEGGSIGRYPDGRLNGELVDTAKRRVTLPPRPEVDAEARLGRLAEELQRLNAVGLTSIRIASATPEMYRGFEALRDSGRLPLRVSLLLRIGGDQDPETLEQTMDAWGIGPDDGDAFVRVSGIKLGVDGGFEGGWMTAPYEEPFGQNGTYHGLQTFPTDSYVAIVRKLNEKGWRVATHAVGDAAIDLVLDAYETANDDADIGQRRFAIEHAFVAREDQLPRMKALGLHISAQHHLYLAAPSLETYWGIDRAREVTPVKTYLDHGLDVSLGTDSPVVPYPPLWVLYHFITRDTMSAGTMGEDQRVGREAALRAMSVGGAALDFQEQERGTIEPGKLADLVVLEEDILTCEPARIRDMKVAMTMVGGRLVYRR